MCGIVGAFDLTGRRAFSPERLAAMAASLRHRGPDDAACHMAPGIAMATQRLALRDPAHGRQPLSDPSGRVWASCNGELFNHAELSRQLESRGHTLRTRCDTELWPLMYDAWGDGAFERARGQFAVALFDERERALLLARDRVGICPLFHAQADGWLLWASEIKALLASGLVEARADVAGVDHVFTLFATGTRRTCFEGVSSLYPGHFMRTGAGAPAIRRYWDIDFAPADAAPPARVEALVDEAEACIARAVSRRLEADAPVATYLSSGLDSALVLAFATRASADITSFTIGFDGAGFDERSGASRAASALGARLRTLVITTEMLTGALPLAVEAAESPIMDNANAALLLLSREVRAQGFRAVLTGEGADEAMAGYVWNKSAALLGALGRLSPSIPALLRERVGLAAAPGTPRPTLDRFFGDGVRPAQLDLYEPLSRARFLFYTDEMARRAAAFDHLAELDLSPVRMRRWAPLDRSLYLDYKLMLPGHLLVGKGDRVAMSAGVEPRFPFLDEAFIDLASSVGPSLKLRGLTEKWLLRQVARRVLPRALGSPKKGMFRAFSLAELSPQPRWVDQLLSADSLDKTGYFSRARVERERRLQRTLSPSSPRRYVADAAFTAVVTTQLFHHIFLGGGLCDLPRWSPPARPAPLLHVSPPQHEAA